MRQPRKPHVGTPGVWRAVTLTLAALTLTHALAANPTFGVLLSPATLTLSAGLPIAHLPLDAGVVSFGVRADASSALDRLTATPSIGMQATVDFEPTHGIGSLYAGTGIALARQPTLTGTISTLTWTILAGVRLPIDPTWAAVLQLAAAPLLGGIGIGIGLEVTPWP
jgi:hypothetical protein